MRDFISEFRKDFNEIEMEGHTVLQARDLYHRVKSGELTLEAAGLEIIKDNPDDLEIATRTFDTLGKMLVEDSNNKANS